MKRIIGIVMVLGLVGALKVMAQEVNLGKVDVVDFGGGVKLEMVLVPAGKFKMGFTKKIWEDFKAEMTEEFKRAYGKTEIETVDYYVSVQGKPHEVTLTKPFFMGKYEVTQEQYESVMGKNPSRNKGVKLPVTNVSWDDCQKFIKKLNDKTTGGFRLPTEAEWEYSCWAGTTTRYSWNKMTHKDANYFPINSLVKDTVAVGSYKPNAFGLYDMHGNVWEWCEDWHGDKYPFAVIDPKGPAKGEYRVLRGGSFSYYAKESSIFLGRWGRMPDSDGFDCGFRLARTK